MSKQIHYVVSPWFRPHTKAKPRRKWPTASATGQGRREAEEMGERDESYGSHKRGKTEGQPGKKRDCITFKEF